MRIPKALSSSKARAKLAGSATFAAGFTGRGGVHGAQHTSSTSPQERISALASMAPFNPNGCTAPERASTVYPGEHRARMVRPDRITPGTGNEAVVTLKDAASEPVPVTRTIGSGNTSNGANGLRRHKICVISRELRNGATANDTCG